MQTNANLIQDTLSQLRAHRNELSELIYLVQGNHVLPEGYKYIARSFIRLIHDDVMTTMGLYPHSLPEDVHDCQIVEYVDDFVIMDICHFENDVKSKPSVLVFYSKLARLIDSLIGALS